MADTLDEGTLEEMEKLDENTNKPRRQAPAVVLPKSRFNVETLRAAYGEKVPVKCISELKPWSSEKQLEFWRDYELKPEDAVQLDRQRMVVILQPMKSKENKNVAS